MGSRSLATVNVPLTTYAYGIMQDRIGAMRLANLLCPVVQVGAAAGTFKVYDDRNAFLAESFKRGLGGVRKRIKADASDGSYNCTPYGAEIALDDFSEELAGGTAFTASNQTQAELKLKAMLSRKATSYVKDVADFVFANLTAVSGRGNWSNPDIDPIDQIDEQLDALSKTVGTTENISVIMSTGEWRTLRSNAQVKKRLQLSGNMTLTRQMFVDALLYPVNLEISGVIATGTKFGQTTVTKSRVMAGYCICSYSQPNPTPDDASAFKCFSTSPALVDSIKEYREEQSNSMIYATDWSQDLKATGTACAIALAIS